MHNQHSPSHNQFWGLLAKKLANEATPEELQELHSVLLNNTDLHHQAEMLEEMWKQQASINSVGSEAAYMRHIMKHKDEFFADESQEGTSTVETVFEENAGFFRSIFSRKRLAVLSFAAFMILAVGGIYLFTQKRKTDAVAEQAISSVVTKNGNRTKIVLPDGSQVWLNAGSNIDYNNSSFNKELREVTLNGEAYFDVTKNAEKPFIIHTKKMDIKVIGTAFNVRSYGNEKIAEAALFRGSIEVTLKDRKNQKILLKPNEKISIATEEHQQPVTRPGKTVVVKNETSPIPQIVVKEIKPSPTYNIISEIAWTQNKLLFEDETLEDIAPLIERWFGKKVVIQNDALKNVHYTGNYDNETMEEVLSSLKLSKPFNFRIENDTVLIY